MKAAHHAAKGHAKKHAHAHKHVHHHHAKHHPKHHKPAHHHHTKHKVKTVGHHQSHAKGLALSPGDVACCVSEALAASLRHLQPPGLSITDADVLALHRAAGADDDRGAPILAVLEAASEIGLASSQLASFAPACAPDVRWPARSALCLCWGSTAYPGGGDGALILGVDLPGPHTVLATPEGWWSWGELYCPWCEFPDAVVDEAWAVSWR